MVEADGKKLKLLIGVKYLQECSIDRRNPITTSNNLIAKLKAYQFQWFLNSKFGRSERFLKRSRYSSEETEFLKSYNVIDFN